MAVSSEVARVVHIANGAATFFSFAPIDGVTPANLKVYLFNPVTGVLTLQTLGTHYTFGSGGVTFTTAPPAGRRVILYRVVPLLQPDNYKTNAPFPAVVTENRFDELAKGLQQLNDIVQNRAIILPLGDAGFSANTLPAVESRKGRVLYFNATTGDPEAKILADTVITVPAWAQAFLSQPTAAAGRSYIGAVAKTGDTMTGPLTLSGPPTNSGHAATKDYVDTKVATDAVQKSGDTMTGHLTLPGTPSDPGHAATKSYVDTAVSNRVAKTGDTMTGHLTLPGAPSDPSHAATKSYVDTTVSNRVAKTGDTMTGNLVISVNNGQLRLNSVTPTFRSVVFSTNSNSRWAAGANSATESGGNTGSDFVINRYDDSGSFLSSPLHIARSNAQITFSSPHPIIGPSAAPTAPNHLATKDYVDSYVASGPYVLKTGDTMTGPLILPSGSPTSPNQAITRGFANHTLPFNQTAAHSNSWSGTFILDGSSFTNFFDILLLDNVYRIHVTCWYMISMESSTQYYSTYNLRYQLLDHSLNVVATRTLAVGAIQNNSSPETPMYSNGGGCAAYDSITTPNSGWRLRFQASGGGSGVAAKIYAYQGDVYCVRRPSP